MTKNLDKAKHRGAALQQRPEEEKLAVPPHPTTRPPLSPQAQLEMQRIQEAQAMAQGGPAGKEEAPAKKEEEKEERQILLESDILALGAYQMSLRDAYATDTNRIAIESRVAPIDLEDLLELYEIKQKVPILRHKEKDLLAVTYRTVSHFEETELKEAHAPLEELGTLYAAERMAVERLSLHVVSINGVDLPDYRNSEGKINAELLEARSRVISRYAAQIVTKIQVNHTWFEGRIYDLCREENWQELEAKLKNG